MRKFRERFAIIVKREQHLERLVKMKLDEQQARRNEAVQRLEALDADWNEMNEQLCGSANPALQLGVAPYMSRLRTERTVVRTKITEIDAAIQQHREILRTIQRRLAQFDELRTRRFESWQTEKRRSEESLRQESVLRRTVRAQTEMEV